LLIFSALTEIFSVAAMFGYGAASLMNPDAQFSAATPSVRNERSLLLLLAAIQFTTVLDFLIIMPLGPQYIRVFHITPGQFGLIVSAYAFSAGIFGVVAGFFLDRFDRKTALLWLFAGFAVGTFFCALAPTYELLIAARFVAGAFGGVVGALVMAIVGDVIPLARRGAAMGMVMSAFSVASICGVPVGLALASHLSWHAPFLALAAISVVILLAGVWVLPPLRDHLRGGAREETMARMRVILSEGGHQRAFLFTAVLTFTSFLVVPYISNYMVANAGLTEKQLPYIYLCGGLTTLFSMNLIGRWADRVGKRRAFVVMSASCAVQIVAVTNLPRVPVALAVTVSTVFMVCMSGRFVPGMALITATVEARYRGGFMSINSAVQQFASGLAAFLSGLIIGETAAGAMTRYWLAGAMAVAMAFVGVYLVQFLTPHPENMVSEPLLPVAGDV